MKQTASEFLFFPFQSPQWEQQWVTLTLLTALLSVVFLPLAEVIEMGYALQMARRVLAQSGGLEGSFPSLPERIAWPAVFRDGLRWWVVSFLYNLPALLVFAASAGLFAARYGQPRGGDWLGLAQGWPVLALGFAASLPLALLGGWLSNVAVMNLARRDQLSAAFRPADWGGVLRANLGGMVKTLLLTILVALGVGVVQLIVSIPAAVLVVLPIWVAAFFSLYQRVICTALYARAFCTGIDRQRLSLHE